MTLSPFALEDLEALCLEPSLLMVDPGGPLLDQDDEAAFIPSSHSAQGGKATPPPSLCSRSAHSSPPQPAHFSKPSPTPSLAQSSSLLGTKADPDLLSSPWLLADDVGDYDPALDWMTEKMDLDQLDLESLIGSCSSGDAPSSPEELLASLDSQMSLDLEDFSAGLPTPYGAALHLSLPDAPESKMEVGGPSVDPVKSEPCSPAPLSPTYTIKLGGEVDLLDAGLATAFLPAPSGALPAPVVLSIPAPGHLLLLLANEDEPSVASLPEETKSSASSDSDSDSGIESAGGSPPRLPSSPPSTPPPGAGSSRTKPYSKPEPSVAPPPRAAKVKLASAPKVVEKKMKKMEQNKTAATRYRQKKRVEQEQLSTELGGLERKNQELQEQAQALAREIQYLHDLVEEVRKHHRGKAGRTAPRLGREVGGATDDIIV